MDRKVFEAPVFFPSASRVKLPFVGDDTRSVKVKRPNISPPINPLQKHQDAIGNNVIRDVSKDMDFSVDVVKKRCAHLLPYRSMDVQKIYDPAEVIPQHSAPKPNSPLGGRFDSRGYIRKVPGHLKQIKLPNASAMKKQKRTVTERCGEFYQREDKPVLNEGDTTKIRSVFLTDQPVSPRDTTKNVGAPKHSSLSPRYREAQEKHKGYWDEQVLNRLSKDTARWIVFDNLDPGFQKDRLDRLVRNKFGEKISNTHLVREGADESDFDLVEKRAREEKIKLREKNKIKAKEMKLKKIKTDGVLQQTVAEYYKLPKFLKQEQSKVVAVKDDINQTVQNLQVKHMEPPPPPKMEDFLNPAAGNYIKSTDNAFEQQLYTNQAKPVFQHDGDKSRIIMSDLSEYQSDIQIIYPPNCHQWSGVKSSNKKTKANPITGKITVGFQRWKGLPQPADFASELGLNPPKQEVIKFKDFHISKSDTMLDNAPMIHIIEEWRSKWTLAGRWQEVTLADIMIDLDNIHDHMRLGAVAACAMAALHKLPVADITLLAVLPKIDASAISKSSEKGHLPEVLIKKVWEKLKDKNKRVKLAAAMCLYTLSECNDDVVEILEYNLHNGVPTDRMACAQCLALNGNIDAKVIHLIIKMLLETDQHEQASSLLVHISQNTRLVHSLLAEQLNSSNWKDKAMACNVLSLLSGNINRDLVHKFSNLMWDDWSSEVRKAASCALGKTGHGRDVHFDLRDKLQNGNERVRTDALRKIGHLGIMTATLLSEFMKCFSAEYVSIRLESCITANKLKIKDERVIAQLTRLMQYDPAWKIKAYAIKAIGEIGEVNPKIESALMWALRFEDEPGVRMEACVAIRKLKIKNEEIVLILQDRVLVEPVNIVKEEVKATLEIFGLSGPEDNMEMVRQIKTEVKRLCKKSVVAAKIIMFEKELDKFERRAQYIGNLLDDMTSSGEFCTDDIDEPEIQQALQHSSSGGKARTTLSRTPSIMLTPSQNERLKTAVETPVQSEVLLQSIDIAPSSDEILQIVPPTVGPL